MRLWHYKLLPYLPKSQLIAQWRELNSIYKKQDRHILINYIYDYDEVFNKLGKLEDIEQELGIGLIDLWEKVKGAKNNELSDAVGLLIIATLFAADNPKKFINDLAQEYKDAMIEEVNNDRKTS